MRPNKVNGLTQQQRHQMCERKRRFADELGAHAMGLIELERVPSTLYLWTYQCRACKGWHLTHKRVAGKAPIQLDPPTNDERKTA